MSHLIAGLPSRKVFEQDPHSTSVGESSAVEAEVVGFDEEAEPLLLALGMY